MTKIYVDRRLKELLVGLIKAMGFDYASYRVYCAEYYKEKDQEKIGKEYIKKLKSPTVTWKTYLQTLKTLDFDDATVKLGIEFNLPISSTEWGPMNTVWYTFTNFEHTVNDLSASELSLFLSAILEESEVSQPTYVNRIIAWMLDNNPQLDTLTVRTRASGFIKKVAGDNVTWSTFLDALSALGIKDAIYKVDVLTKDDNHTEYSMRIIGDNE